MRAAFGSPFLFQYACRRFSQPIYGPLRRDKQDETREKALRFQIRINTIPCIEGQPLPRRLLTCPALAVVAAAVPDPLSRASCWTLPDGGYHWSVSAPIAPKNNAGANTPPKKPKPRQSGNHAIETAAYAA